MFPRSQYEDMMNNIKYPSNSMISVISFWDYSIDYIYRVIQNKRAKIKQDIGDAPLNNLR